MFSIANIVSIFTVAHTVYEDIVHFFVRIRHMSKPSMPSVPPPFPSTCASQPLRSIDKIVLNKKLLYFKTTKVRATKPLLPLNMYYININ